MRSFILPFLFLTALAGNAQYEKVSRFKKFGATYGLTANYHLFSDGREPSPGYALSIGNDNGRTPFWAEIEYIPSIKFSYNSRNPPTGAPGTVTGKLLGAVVTSINFSWYLNRPPEGDEIKNDSPVSGFWF